MGHTEGNGAGLDRGTWPKKALAQLRLDVHIPASSKAGVKTRGKAEAGGKAKAEAGPSVRSARSSIQPCVLAMLYSACRGSTRHRAISFMYDGTYLQQSINKLAGLNLITDSAQLLKDIMNKHLRSNMSINDMDKYDPVWTLHDHTCAINYHTSAHVSVFRPHLLTYEPCIHM